MEENERKNNFIENIAEFESSFFFKKEPNLI